MTASRGRLALWLVAIVFLVQLIAGAHHDHDLKSQHCASCALHTQPQAAPPDLASGIAPFRWVLQHAIGEVPLAALPPTHTDYLLPPPHAPPALPHR